jgi:hypothetical protein
MLQRPRQNAFDRRRFSGFFKKYRVPAQLLLSIPLDRSFVRGCNVREDPQRRRLAISRARESERESMLREHMKLLRLGFLLLLATFAGPGVQAQLDQGAVTGVVQDPTGAVIRNADLILTSSETGLVLHAASDGGGIFTFSPIKIGHYTLQATAPGFATTVQENIIVNIQERVNVRLTLKPGAGAQTVTVESGPPLLQTQSGAVSATFDNTTINQTPLAQRNWVYMAQLAPGVVPSYGTRGGANGDYEANGQREEQNNFILDGVDNNVNIVDYMNGTTYAVAPPPDALQEFRLETSNFSAEYGHSAGSVLNASIKSGTNQIHGDVWEYFRNTNLDARNYFALVNPPYHMNQFGATLGFPILRDKLFYFGDIQSTRITYAANQTYSTPSALERQGDFSELLTPTLTGGSCPIYLFQPNSNTGSYTASTCNSVPASGTLLVNTSGRRNVFNQNQINAVAQNLLNLYPAPNANNGKLFNNLIENLVTKNNTIQWDQRVDWNIAARDQTYVRYSYVHVSNGLTPPLGPILDGTTSYAGISQTYLSENFMVSETHQFSPSTINEFRFSYNYGKFRNLQANYDVDEASKLGLGGMPYGPEYPDNGGLPSVSIGTPQAFGSHGNDPSNEGQNLYQILDNFTKILGNHSLKAGFNHQPFRILFLQPPASRGSYAYSGAYTGLTGVSNTGYGVADFLANQMNSASITNEPVLNDEFRYDAAYIQDSWRVTPKLTIEAGLRYDYYQPYKESAGQMANFIPTSMSFNPATGAGSGTGIYKIPLQSQNVPLSPAFLALLAQDNITLQYDSESRLSKAQKTNFAPRFGFAYTLGARTVVRGGYGIAYSSIQGAGSNANISENYPFVVHASLSGVGCTINKACPSLTTAAINYSGAPNVTLENGLGAQISSGIVNFVASPGLFGRSPNINTPYTESFNLTVQRSFSTNLAASVGYVGNVSRHLTTIYSSDPVLAIFPSGTNTNAATPFPQFSGSNILNYTASSSYNSLQATLEKRASRGLYFTSTYTWSHAMDNSIDPLGGGASYRDAGLIPISYEYTLSNYDVRNRFTFNGNYALPFGKGREYVNRSTWADELVGGWSLSLTYQAQSGLPFTLGSSNVSTVAGATARPIRIGDPFKAGGSPNSTNPTITCPTKVRTIQNWYNPCAFANPPVGTVANGVPAKGSSDLTQALYYTGGLSNTIAGPGFQRLNASLFKNFKAFREQSISFRADCFNVLNHPTWANPSTANLSNTAGTISSDLTLQANTPDARIIQLSAKYIF